MVVALAINVVLLVATVVGGILTDSLALLADAGHLLSDVGAIAIGLVAARLAGRAPTPARTFGLQRSEVLGALANGVLLVVDLGADRGRGAGAARSIRPTCRAAGCWRSGSRAWPATLAATWVLAAGDRERPQPRGRAAALGGGRAQLDRGRGRGGPVLATGWDEADPIASLLIAGLILAGSWRLLKEPVDVLLEAAPAGTDVSRGRRARWPPSRDVVEVHDLHVWTVTSGFPALSAHVSWCSRGCRSRPGAAQVERLPAGALRHHAHDAAGWSSEHARSRAGLIQVEPRATR